MTTARTPTQRGRASRAKGARFERQVANALRPWLPDVRRSRDNGSSTTTDTGDLADAGPGLWWSLKDVAAAHTDPPALVASWLAEAQEKASAGRLPLLVQKRAGHRDPLMSWCWLRLDHLRDLIAVPGGADLPDPDAPIRLELRTLLPLLAAARYIPEPDGRLMPPVSMPAELAALTDTTKRDTPGPRDTPNLIATRLKDIPR